MTCIKFLHARAQKTFLPPPPHLNVDVKVPVEFLRQTIMNLDFGFIVKILRVNYTCTCAGLHAAVTYLMFLC